ncbi:hypothetical protein FIBSPDRAFT_522105 [Athelia psychrophila]|uniref:Uncharacterized protein n=1 Tax=Athelia psychrophila TaxID=1759441 RepID=A0A167TEI7_9AGAM|nr:hypothetical protein FIBSPDRAFT_546100 [Fibularhizoctonia sp. CBS 109695]KZP03049.1 hypothetical protein FIBSPDRAFT_522105 [Fibularhizoctonia sp. CBS 109695]
MPCTSHGSGFHWVPGAICLASYTPLATGICRWIFCDFQGRGRNENGGAETVATCYGEVVVFSPRVTARSNITVFLDLYWPAGAFKSCTCHPLFGSPFFPLLR